MGRSVPGRGCKLGTSWNLLGRAGTRRQGVSCSGVHSAGVLPCPGTPSSCGCCPPVPAALFWLLGLSHALPAGYLGEGWGVRWRSICPQGLRVAVGRAVPQGICLQCLSLGWTGLQCSPCPLHSGAGGLKWPPFLLEQQEEEPCVRAFVQAASVQHPQDAGSRLGPVGRCGREMGGCCRQGAGFLPDVPLS